jgi:membrane-bound ClpP family serine protease
MVPFKLLRAIFKARRRKRRPSLPQLFSSAVVNTDLNPNGSVLANGELWTAAALNPTSISRQTKVTIVGFRDHLLLVTESA